MISIGWSFELVSLLTWVGIVEAVVAPDLERSGGSDCGSILGRVEGGACT